MINDIPLMVTFACGGDHMIALAKPNKGESVSTNVFVWGSNEYGQLGIVKNFHFIIFKIVAFLFK